MSHPSRAISIGRVTDFYIPQISSPTGTDYRLLTTSLLQLTIRKYRFLQSRFPEVRELTSRMKYDSYAPAYRRHASDVSVLHFIGPEKPWTSGNRSTASSISSRSQSDYYGLVNKWFDVFERHFGTNTSTSSIASRIVAPPASFKSNTSPQPLLTPKAAAAAADSTWNPALSSPPRESGFQMQESIGPRYGNVWDDSSLRRQKQRFEPPAAYAPPPASTHEWYRNVMSTPSDPTAVRPVFPWEETTSQPDVVVRPSPSITRSSPLPKAASRSQSQPQQTGFRNAWDQIPNIDKIAREFARATNMNRATSLTVEATSSSTRKSRANIGRDDLGGRTSSLKEPRSYEPRSEATSDDSSRDGDDEEDEENSISSTEKVPILFKSRSSSIASNDSGGERRSPRNRTTSTSSNESLGLDEGNYSKVSTSPTLSKAAGPSALVPLHHQSSHPYHHTRTLSYPPPGSPTTTPHPIKSALRLNLAPTPFASSPQLAAQAIRNTAATRVANGGGEGGAPVVSRRFTPETDVESMKRSSLLALRRVMDIEKNGPGSV